MDNLSIIIASNLRNISIGWIEQINSYAESGIIVIISIPPHCSLNETYNIGFSKKINIVNSDKIGQVHQRQFAAKLCQTEFLMQMDDDIFFDLESIKKLLNSYIKLPNKSCLAPYLAKELRAEYHSKNIIFLKNILLYSEKKPYPGKIAKSSFPIPHKINRNEHHEVEWLAGGLVIIRTKHFIKHNYYKFKGKAYCEDLINSYFLKKRGIKLFLTSKLSFKTDEESYRNYSFTRFIKYLYRDFVVRNYYRKMINKKLIPLIIAYIYLIISFTGSRLKIKNPNLYKSFL